MKGTNEFDGIEDLDQLLETHDKFHEFTRIAEPLQTAVQQLNGLGVKAITNSLEAGLKSQLLDAGHLANLNGPLQATSDFAAALERYHDHIPLTQGLDNIVTAEQMLGTKLDNLIQPSVYATNISSALADLASSAKGVTEDIDFSWMQRQSPWLVEPSILQSIDILGLSKAESSLASLLQAEKETARLSAVASDVPMMTSAATQIASINQMYLSMEDAWRDSVISTEMLGEYYRFAKKQHEDIQKAAFLGDEATVAWRLDVLENTAKFVDRQVAWTTDFAVDVQGELEECETDIPVLENSVDVGKIPQYIGYSKRDKVNVNEAFQKSDFVAITEKGKSIAQKIRVIQEKCSQQPDIDLFKDTNDCFNVCLNLANSFCTKPSELTTLVDCIHQLFHQYRDRILAIIGKDSHDCFIFIEDLLKESIYPERGKEIAKKQNSLYDNILSLVDDIIASLDATAPIRTDDKYSEETVCKMIFKSLNNIQKNKIYYGKTEDELNDVMRDSLEMVYQIKDQTRQGVSQSGKGSGEIDIQICNENMPYAIIEGLKVDSVNKDYIETHLNKLLTKYDPVGCPMVYALIYASVNSFDKFWKKCFAYICDEYDFPYSVVEGPEEIHIIYTNSRHAKVILERNGRKVSLHIFAILLHQ